MPGFSTKQPSLTVNIMLVTVGAVLLYSGVKRVNIVDAALGQIPATTGGAAITAASSSSNTGNLPSGLVIFDGHPVSKWIANELMWARHNGWRGVVESGYRTALQQDSAASNYGLSKYSSSGPQGSNHRKINYPGGAVDVTNAAQLNQVLEHKPDRHLTWGGPVIGDTVHFSATGH